MHAHTRITALIAGVALISFTQAGMSQNDIPLVRFEVKDFAVEGDNPLDADKTGKILDPFVGEHVGLAALKAAADELEAEIRDSGFSFRRVIVPPQRLGDGVVTLQVVDFKLGDISVSGNERFSEQNILASLPGLEVGEVPSAPRMSRAVRFANEHPAKNIVLTFRESETENAVDARIKVRDEKPWNVFGLTNNTGTEETGEERLSVGAQHNNIWNRDHEATVSYTTSPEQTEDVSQGALIYRWPIYPIAGEVGAYAVQSEVDSGIVADAFEVSGRGDFLGLNYSQYLGVLGRYTHKVTLAADDKRFDNDIDFEGSELGVDVRSAPVSLGYSGNFKSTRYTTAFSLSYRANISGGTDNDDDTYDATRSGAEADWDAFKLDASFQYFFAGGWWTNFVLAGQSTDQPLIPGEQFGIGGATSVRGFDERVVSGDVGARATVEVNTPVYSGFSGKLFFDAGRVELEDVQPGEIADEEIASGGIGLAWRWRRNLSLTVDAAQVTDGTADVDDGETKTHVSLYARF